MTSQACVVCGRVSPRARCPLHGLPANRHSHPGRGTAAYRSTRERVMERDGWVCRWCGRELSREGGRDGLPVAHMDHVVPRAKLGGDELENLCASCGECNRRRGAHGGAP